MKISRISLLAVLILTSTFGTSPSTSLEEGLVAYYSFNYCDARDESGNNSHGNLFGSIGCWCGIEDDGLLLDGANDYIEFPGKVNRYFNTTDFSVSFYFKAEQYLIFQQSLLSKRQDCEEYHMLDLMLNMNSRDLLPSVHETPVKYYSGLSTPLDSTGWIHFVLVREGTQASTYINGQLRQQSFRCSGVDISNESVLSFSNSPCIQQGDARRFKGVLDELRIYNRALSRDEVEMLYKLHPVENAQMDCFT